MSSPTTRRTSSTPLPERPSSLPQAASQKRPRSSPHHQEDADEINLVSFKRLRVEDPTAAAAVAAARTPPRRPWLTSSHSSKRRLSPNPMNDVPLPHEALKRLRVDVSSCNNGRETAPPPTPRHSAAAPSHQSSSQTPTPKHSNTHHLYANGRKNAVRQQAAGQGSGEEASHPTNSTTLHQSVTTYASMNQLLGKLHQERRKQQFHEEIVPEEELQEDTNDSARHPASSHPHSSTRKQRRVVHLPANSQLG